MLPVVVAGSMVMVAVMMPVIRVVAIGFHGAGQRVFLRRRRKLP